MKGLRHIKLVVGTGGGSFAIVCLAAKFVMELHHYYERKTVSLSAALWLGAFVVGGAIAIAGIGGVLFRRFLREYRQEPPAT